MGQVSGRILLVCIGSLITTFVGVGAAPSDAGSTEESILPLGHLEERCCFIHGVDLHEYRSPPGAIGYNLTGNVLSFYHEYPCVPSGPECGEKFGYFVGIYAPPYTALVPYTVTWRYVGPAQVEFPYTSG